jgi:hypothetical protein
MTDGKLWQITRGCVESGPEGAVEIPIFKAIGNFTRRHGISDLDVGGAGYV